MVSEYQVVIISEKYLHDHYNEMFQVKKIINIFVKFYLTRKQPNIKITLKNLSETLFLRNGYNRKKYLFY